MMKEKSLRFEIIESDLDILLNKLTSFERSSSLFEEEQKEETTNDDRSSRVHICEKTKDLTEMLLFY